MRGQIMERNTLEKKRKKRDLEMLNITKLPQWGDTIRWGRLSIKRRRKRKGSMQYTLEKNC
jgi:hypothetical protein